MAYNIVPLVVIAILITTGLLIYSSCWVFPHSFLELSDEYRGTYQQCWRCFKKQYADSLITNVKIQQKEEPSMRTEDMIYKPRISKTLIVFLLFALAVDEFIFKGRYRQKLENVVKVGISKVSVLLKTLVDKVDES